MQRSIITQILLYLLILIILLTFAYAFKGIIEMPRNLEFIGLRFNLYGLILGIAFVTVSQQFQQLLTKKEFRLVKPIFPWLILSMLICARAWHVITDFELYKNNLITVFYIWNGGLSIFGALLGLFVPFIILTKIWNFNIEILGLFEKLALSIPIGQFIGRLGNFVNYELFGTPTNLPWGMFVPEKYRPIEFASSQFFHPAFLYEMIGTGFLFLSMKFLYRKQGIKGDGTFFYLYLTGYGAIRFLVDFSRTDPDVIWILSLGQIVCLLMIAFGVSLFALRTWHFAFRT